MSSLKPIFGSPISSDFVADHKRICDLIDVEYPLLSLYSNAGNYWLQLWCDCESNLANRWLIIPVSDARLSAYLAKQATMLDVINSASQLILGDCSGWHFQDLSAEESRGTTRLFRAVTREQIADYLPSDDSFFDESLTDDLETIQRVAASLTRDWTNSFVSDNTGEVGPEESKQ